MCACMCEVHTVRACTYTRVRQLSVWNRSALPLRVSFIRLSHPFRQQHCCNTPTKLKANHNRSSYTHTLRVECIVGVRAASRSKPFYFDNFSMKHCTIHSIGNTYPNWFTPYHEILSHKFWNILRSIGFELKFNERNYTEASVMSASRPFRYERDLRYRKYSNA